MWRNSYKCFTCGKNLCYKILTYLCGICIALAWGCEFACVSFYVIWFFGPMVRLLHIMLHPIKKIYQIYLSSKPSSFILKIFKNSLNKTLYKTVSFLIEAFLGPCMETFGLLFSRIHVTQSNGEEIFNNTILKMFNIN